MSKYLYFICISSWFFTSVVIDMVAVPAVFRNVSNIAEAGTVGMIVFSKYNILELVFSLGSLISIYLNKTIAKFNYIFAALFILFINATVYTFYLSPRIVEINKKLYRDEIALDIKETLQAAHDFHHHLYVGLEKGKVILLLLLLGFSLYLFNKKEKETV